MREQTKPDIAVILAENAQLKTWIADLQSGMFVNCVYCGHRYGPADKVPATMADALKQHIAKCEKHPMSKLIKAGFGAVHTIGSLLAVRDGIPDESLRDMREFIAKTLIDAGAMSAKEWEKQR